MVAPHGNRVRTIVDHIDRYLADARTILDGLDRHAIARLLDLIVDLRERDGRLFIIGVGGGAGHASHAVNDFRKIAGIEAYAPSDNVSELTARINDEGWESAYAEWLRVSRISPRDMVLVLSVGGGDPGRGISTILVSALETARAAGCTIGGIVGRDGGHTARVADACVVVPSPNPAMVTPHTEAFQAVIWHLLVSHPRLQRGAMKWESVGPVGAAAMNSAGV